jgi:hypothetical protein
MKKLITCPVQFCLAELQYEVSPENAKILGATKCSLIDGEVDCDQECIKRMKLRQEAMLVYADSSESTSLVDEA